MAKIKVRKRNQRKNPTGFRGLKKSQVYIAKPTLAKQAPKDETVEVLKDVWNNQGL